MKASRQKFNYRDIPTYEVPDCTDDAFRLANRRLFVEYKRCLEALHLAEYAGLPEKAVNLCLGELEDSAGKDALAYLNYLLWLLVIRNDLEERTAIREHTRNVLARRIRELLDIPGAFPARLFPVPRRLMEYVRNRHKETPALTPLQLQGLLTAYGMALATNPEASTVDKEQRSFLIDIDGHVHDTLMEIISPIDAMLFGCAKAAFCRATFRAIPLKEDAGTPLAVVATVDFSAGLLMLMRAVQLAAPLYRTGADGWDREDLLARTLSSMIATSGPKEAQIIDYSIEFSKRLLW